MRLSAGTESVLDMCRDSWGKGVPLIMRQHTNTPSRPVAAISLLLALILPASLITGGLAAADTTTSQPVIATGPTMTGNNERGNRQTSRVARQNSVISPSSAISTTPQSSLPAPSPLNTASPLTPTPPLLTSSSSPKATTSKPGKSDDNPHQTRSTQHTVTFKDDSTTLSKQSIADGTRARRPPQGSSQGQLPVRRLVHQGRQRRLQRGLRFQPARHHRLHSDRPLDQGNQHLEHLPHLRASRGRRQNYPDPASSTWHPAQPGRCRRRSLRSRGIGRQYLHLGRQPEKPVGPHSHQQHPSQQAQQGRDPSKHHLHPRQPRATDSP